MRLPTLLALTGLLALANATPVTPAVPRALPQVQPRKPLVARQNDTLPACAKVSQALYATPRPSQIPAGIAYDCLTSAPLNATAAKSLLRGLPAFLQWQSTLDALKNPPAEYVEKQFPSIDLLGGLKQIEAQIDASNLTSEYAFGWQLYTLLTAAHDGHLTYIPDSVGAVFNWGRTVPLVSVSADGTQLPGIFTFYDVLGMKYKNITYTPSPVVEIDGQDAKTFLEDYSEYGSLQDRDALYNAMFYELAQVSLGSFGGGVGMFAGGGRARYVFPGETTTLKFANGTEYTMQNYARFVGDNFRGITTGEQLAAHFFTYNVAGAISAVPPPPAAEAEAAEDAPAPSAAPGYPVPIVAGPINTINGFYVNAPGYEDVAVLQVPSFVSSQSAEIGFQRTTQEFLPKAVAAGKTKLIIDLQANGGGTVMQGYDLFKQLFPSEDPWGANRFRYHEAADLIGQVFSELASTAPRPTNNYTLKSIQSSWFDYHMDMTVDGKPFSSWKQKVGPVDVNGDKYTTLERWNLNDPYLSFVSGGINVTGYGSLANVTGPPKFKPENIVLLTDGYCASTCTIFSELTRQVGIKTIAMGGRANKKPIQAIGGVKGVNNMQFAYIQSVARAARQFASPAMRSKINNGSALDAYDSLVVVSRAASGPGLNVRDGLSKNDTSTALQFVYEEADCRLYYTPEMTVDATAIWKAAADAQWGGKGKCVGGASYADVATLAEGDDVSTTTTRIKLAQADSQHSMADFEKTFQLETACHVVADGFMMP